MWIRKLDTILFLLSIFTLSVFNKVRIMLIAYFPVLIIAKLTENPDGTYTSQKKKKKKKKKKTPHVKFLKSLYNSEALKIRLVFKLNCFS